MGIHCGQGVRYLTVTFLILALIPFTGCELSKMPELMKQSIALQQELLKTSQAMHEDMQKMNAALGGMMGQIKDAAKEMGDEMLKKAFDKALVMYMMARKDIKAGINDFATLIGPQIMKSLADVPPDQLQKIGRVFGEFLKQGGLTDELKKLNSSLTSLGGGLTGGAAALTGGGANAQFKPTASTAPKDGASLPIGNNSAGFAAKNATASLRGIAAAPIERAVAESAAPSDLVELPVHLPVVRRGRTVQ